MRQGCLVRPVGKSGERGIHFGSAMAAAHRTLPFGTRVKVENLSNGRSVVVRINDRGPAERDRIIDLSRAAAQQLGFIQLGIAEVRLTTIDGGDWPLDRPCLDDAVAASGPVPLPRARPLPAADMIAPTISARFGDAMAARFGLAFQNDDWVQTEMAKAIEALSGGDGRH
jgi:rare lipoprotein A (peptidoglycan hydrolase)